MLMEASLGHAGDRYLTAAYRYTLPQILC